MVLEDRRRRGGDYAYNGKTQEKAIPTAGSPIQYNNPLINQTTMASSRATVQPPARRTRRQKDAASDPTPASNGTAGDAADDTGADPRVKYQLPDLELRSTLGTGTFGRVVLAQHRPTKKYFALKIMTISEVIRLKQIDHVRSEKSILNTVRHPFIVNMLWSDHDRTYLYMLLEYVPGGELFSYLRNAGRFNNVTGNFFAAEIVSALDYLHAQNIVYRDLKPENLLLDREGHLKLTDFGFAKTLLDRTFTLCGTPEYLAPEIIQSKGHNKAVDWWALGILIYEMLVGYPPFYGERPFGIYKKILSGKLEWPKHTGIDPAAKWPPFYDERPFGIYEKILQGKLELPRVLDVGPKDLIKKLLVQDRTKRLGSMKNGAEDVKRHKWFKHINWDDVVQRKLKPPIVPTIAYEGDTSCFDEYGDDAWKKALPVTGPDMDHFADF